MDEGDAWFELHKWHAGRCAICNERKFRYNGVIDLNIDHCHRCLLVRGFLCTACNLMGDGHPVFQAYSMDPPAKRLGIQLLYYRHRYLIPGVFGLRCGLCWDRSASEITKQFEGER